MKTEQAVLPGGTQFRAPMDSPRRVSPLLWLNLVCLDAPLVAVAWLWLFARTFHVTVHLGNAVALFLTAWMIYLGDRLADALALKPDSPRSLRQEFCLGHREIWIATVSLVAGFDAYVILGVVASETFVAGAVVGVLALIYLVVNHPLGRVWRSLPAKELVIGTLFAAGTVVALLPRLRALSLAFTVTVVAFATLCALNCISIAGWEHDLDLAQGKVSIATRHSRIIGWVGKICVALGVGSLLLALLLPPAALLFACISASAWLLAWLNASPRFKEGRFQNRPRSRNCGINRRSLASVQDERTALADLVLLTPIVFLIVTVL